MDVNARHDGRCGLPVEELTVLTVAPRTTRISLPCALGAICRCSPRTTPQSADRA